jgi:hypothetical protein
MANGQDMQDPNVKASQIARIKATQGMGAPADQPPLFSNAVGQPLPLGVLPRSSPIAPAGLMPSADQAQPTDLDTALQRESLAQSQFGRGQLAEEINRLRGMTDQEAALRKEQAGLRTAYAPKFEPVTGAKSLLRDVGRGALTFLASTRPGQAVEDVVYGPARHQYANLASQIQNIRGQVEGEKEIVPAAASLAYHAPMSMARGMAGEAAQRRAGAAEKTADSAVMNAQTRQISERHRYELESKLLALKDKLGTGKLGEEAKRTIVMQAHNLIEQDHNNAMREISAAHVDEAERANQMKLEEENYKLQKDHYMQTWFHSGPTPPAYTPKNPARPTRPAGSGGGSVVDQLVKKHGG